MVHTKTLNIKILTLQKYQLGEGRGELSFDYTEFKISTQLEWKVEYIRLGFEKEREV